MSYIKYINLIFAFFAFFDLQSASSGAEETIISGCESNSDVERDINSAKKGAETNGLDIKHSEIIVNCKGGIVYVTIAERAYVDGNMIIPPGFGGAGRIVFKFKDGVLIGEDSEK